METQEMIRWAVIILVPAGVGGFMAWRSAAKASKAARAEVEAAFGVTPQDGDDALTQPAAKRIAFGTKPKWSARLSDGRELYPLNTGGLVVTRKATHPNPGEWLLTTRKAGALGRGLKYVDPLCKDGITVEAAPDAPDLTAITAHFRSATNDQNGWALNCQNGWLYLTNTTDSVDLDQPIPAQTLLDALDDFDRAFAAS